MEFEALLVGGIDGSPPRCVGMGSKVKVGGILKGKDTIVRGGTCHRLLAMGASYVLLCHILGVTETIEGFGVGPVAKGFGDSRLGRLCQSLDDMKEAFVEAFVS